MNKTRPNVLIVIAWLLYAWTILNCLTLAFGIDSLAFLFSPFNSIDQLIPNLDNDPDGPIALGTIFLPVLAIIFNLTGKLLELVRNGKSQERYQTRKNILIGTLTLSLIIFILMFTIGW